MAWIRRQSLPFNFSTVQSWATHEKVRSALAIHVIVRQVRLINHFVFDRRMKPHERFSTDIGSSLPFWTSNSTR